VVQGPFVSPSLDLLYNNIYSILTMSVGIGEITCVRQSPIKVVEDVYKRVHFNKKKFNAFFSQSHTISEENVLDATMDDMDSLWIVNGNPDKCITAGQKYVLIIDQNKLASTKKWNKDIVQKHLRLDLIRNKGMSIQLKNKEDVFCPIKAMHQFKWKFHASEYLATVSFQVYRYILEIINDVFFFFFFFKCWKLFIIYSFIWCEYMFFPISSSMFSISC
jgi:hypothetical protein